MFNSGWPKQGYLVMSGNILKEIEVVDRLPKFSMMTPQMDVSHFPRESHPWFVRRWDLVTHANRCVTPHEHGSTSCYGDWMEHESGLDVLGLAVFP